jgi:hypothetical protein
MEGNTAGRRDGARGNRRIEPSGQIAQRGSASPVCKICERRLLDDSSISKKASRQLPDELNPLGSKGNGDG